MPLDAAMADLAALVATALAAVAVVPQLRRVVVAGDARGVSMAAALLGVVNESAWAVYATSAGLWAALPEAVLMLASNGALVIVLRRAGGRRLDRAAHAAVVWAVVLGTIAVVGGAQPLAVALGAAYAVQVAPAVWTAWRTPVPSGIAGSTWVMVVIECLLWAAYGVHHGDPATMTLGAAGVVAGAAMVARTATVRHRTPVVVGR